MWPGPSWWTTSSVSSYDLPWYPFPSPSITASISGSRQLSSQLSWYVLWLVATVDIIAAGLSPRFNVSLVPRFINVWISLHTSRGTIPDEPPKICCRPRLRSSDWQITVTCEYRREWREWMKKTGSRVCTLTALAYMSFFYNKLPSLTTQLTFFNMNKIILHIFKF